MSIAPLTVSPNPQVVFAIATNPADSSFGPYHLSPSVWSSLISDPKLSNTYSVPGFDVSQPYPSRQIDGWTITVSAKQNIPLGESGDRTLTAEEKGKTIAGASMRLNAPEGMNKSVDRSWLVCATFYTLTNATLAKVLKSDDGSCKSLLSDDCIGKIEQATSQGFSEANNGACYLPMLPAECRFDYTASTSLVEFGERSQLRAWGSPPGEDGKAELLAAVTSDITPVLITWGHKRAPDAQKPLSKLICPKIDNPEDNVGSNAERASRTSLLWPVAWLGAQRLLSGWL